jgi:hypothetical protein
MSAITYVKVYYKNSASYRRQAEVDMMALA